MIERNPRKLEIDYFSVIWIIDILALFVFAIPPEALSNRLQVITALLFTATGMKWTVIDRVPNLPYMTALDYFTFMTYVFIFIQTLYSVVMAIIITNFSTEYVGVSWDGVEIEIEIKIKIESESESESKSEESEREIEIDR